MSENKLTWAEFKRIVEKKGVKDSDILAYIDLWHGVKDAQISVEFNGHGWIIEDE